MKDKDTVIGKNQTNHLRVY